MSIPTPSWPTRKSSQETIPGAFLRNVPSTLFCSSRKQILAMPSSTTSHDAFESTPVPPNAFTSSTSSLSSSHGQQQLQVGPASTLEALQSSLQSGKFSDLTITHGSQIWKAHKVVVGSQSAVLETMITNLKNTKTISLDQYPLETLHYTMEYLYSQNYTLPPSTPKAHLNTHLSIFKLGSSLEIPGLAMLSAEKFRHVLQIETSDVDVYFYFVRKIYGQSAIKIEDTPGAITADPYLKIKEILVLTAIHELPNLLNNATRSDFLTLTAEVLEFQVDVMKVMWGECQKGSKEGTEKGELVLCEECGPREEGDGYTAEAECKGCGVEKKIEFL